jgi:imidazoleglycerol-phosphate dehydratase
MDEALAQAAVDLSGRPYLVHHEPDGAPPTIGPHYATTLTRHVFESFTYHAAVALHVIVHGGRDWHHITEAQYKAVARALRAAVELDPREQGVPSTKGVL